ncbi:OTU domain-containing protein 4 [Ascaphus truei]|uniref:OTU domain-containing protein 4 n=1 Tax=Ascaphus truei TaxID=8439 RepID=UPI003F59FF5A
MEGHRDTAGCARASGACSQEEAAMDTHLRSQGLYRKRIAKDGSCLFRAVAEQVLHSQTQHLEIRKSCINYLRANRGQYEAFIEGSFEEYLKCLENPQEWVGQVEISALSLMFKKDFIIYQEPNVPPAYVTENGFSEKILLCFSNGNHYDIIYPIGFQERAALCQSIVFEMLYEKVFGLDVGKYKLEADTGDVTAEVDRYGSGGSGSDTEDDDAGDENKTFADMNGFKSHKNNKNQQRKNGNPAVPRHVLHSLNPAVYRNVEYEVWLKSQRDQQKLDFSIAAGMQYSVGDKCQVRLEPGGKFYNAHIQEVGAENGPVVVFVEEMGKKHDVQLKNLKPLLQTISTSTDTWNTVAGKKIKKATASSPSVQLEKDYRGQKGSGKPVKPPRLQQVAGNKQHMLSSQSPDQATQCETKGRSRTPPKVPGRKVERERSEDSNYSKRESVHFGLSPDERREKQAIEESKSLYEIQSRDEDAFPALSTPPVDQTATQTTEAFPAKKMSSLKTERSTRRKSEGDDRRDKASKLVQPAKVRDLKVAKEGMEHFATSDDVGLHGNAPALPTPAEHQTLTTVPSMPSTAPTWSGISAQIAASPGTASDFSMLQAEVASAPFPPLPVPVPAVNQPLLPLPQTMSPYQDPLYPGLPFNEAGERASAPPYSFCKSGEDLPNDKSILRFFFNLGVKAYSCPMWAPHSYLYPLHQAYWNMCRMYPNIPVYPHNHWVQEASVNQSEVDPLLLIHQNEVRMEGQCSQAATISSPTLVASPVHVPGTAGQISNLSGAGVMNQVQPPSCDFEEPLAGKTMFPQPAFGQGTYLGAVPIAPSFFPHFWYGYPYQGYIENQVVRQNVFMNPQDLDSPENLLSGAGEENNSSIQGAIKQSLDALGDREPDMPPLSNTTTSTESGPYSSSGKIELMAMNARQSVPAQIKDKDNQLALPVPIQTETGEFGCAAQECKETAEKEIDAVAAGTVQMNPPEEKALRTREESSEDEREVSNILNSGRSKQFYSQTYGTRRPRNDRGYQPSRGGYQHVRSEEGWRGQRGREDGFQHHRNIRGRPSRRRPMGDTYRAYHE